MQSPYSNSTSDVNIFVKNIESDAPFNMQYDLKIFALGYENRSCDIPKKLVLDDGDSIAIDLDFNHVLNYQANKNWYQSKNITIMNHKPEAISDEIFSRLNDKDNDFYNVFLDVSSFTRKHIAAIILALKDYTESYSTSIRLDIGYSVAKYSEPGSDGPISFSGPVLSRFSGHPADPSLPSECILGVGYEEGKALGIIEYIEPNRVWLFLPTGTDPKYEESLRLANKTLFESRSAKNLISYKVLNPYSTYLKLESLAASLIHESRPVLIPLGPKIFFALSTLIVLKYINQMSLWRVSAGENTVPKDVIASGNYSFVSAIFSKPDVPNIEK